MTKAISAAALGFVMFLPYEGTESSPALAPRVDVSAILRSWRLKGVLVCPHHGHMRKCWWVENAYPCGILEVVHSPWTSHMAEAAGLLKTGQGVGPAVTSSAGADRGQSNLQFADARVYTFIPPLPEALDIPIARPRGPFFAPHYLSELDAWGWRTGIVDRLLQPLRSRANCEKAPDPHNCAGRWGAYWPREGFVVQQSEPMAAYLQALRAGRAASSPMGRFAITPYPFEPRTGHFIQMMRPVPRPAIRIGHAGPIDQGAGSLHGAYLFVHLGIFEECRRCLPPRLVEVR